MMKLLLLLTTLFQLYSAFNYGLWRGTTTYYLKDKNTINLDLSKPKIYTYNFTNETINNNLRNYILDTKNLNLKLRSSNKLGGIISRIPRNHNWILDNSKSYSTEVNFYHETCRSIISFNYTYDENKNLKLYSVITSALRCGHAKSYKFRLRLTNITSLVKILEDWSYCKSTKINPLFPHNNEVKILNEFDYKYLLTNENRINKILTDNIIISIPNTIEEYKPFTFLVGCLISPNCYKQLNINYNFNGELMSVEFNEYEPLELD